MKLDWKLVVGVIIIAFMLGGTLFSMENYTGGWTMTASPYLLTEDGISAGIGNMSINDDGLSIIPSHMDWAIHDDPAITVEMGTVHYMQSAMGQWQYSSTASLLDSYTVNLNATAKQVYQCYMVAFDVTLKTDAASFTITRPVGDLLSVYGSHYEMNPVSVGFLATFALSQWSVKGTDGNWTTSYGWAGAMSASVLACSYGLVESNAKEDYGHVIQNLNSVNSALPMYVNGNPTAGFDFNKTGALKGVPSTVQIGMGARLGAGASYTVDTIGAWNSVAVHNVYVTYSVGVEVLATLVWVNHLSHIGPLDKPDEDNTNYAPQLPGWLQGLIALASSGFGFILIIIVIVGVFVVAFEFVKHRGR